MSIVCKLNNPFPHLILYYSTSPTNKSSKVRGKLQYEKDKETLSRRQKQIEYGKNTLGYQRYIKLVPRSLFSLQCPSSICQSQYRSSIFLFLFRETREKRHPKTPPRHLRYSRRAWDGLVKVWRQKLHFWDPPKDGEETPTELPERWVIPSIHSHCGINYFLKLLALLVSWTCLSRPNSRLSPLSFYLISIIMCFPWFSSWTAEQSDDCSASMSDTTSERSIPSTPQSGRKSNRKCSQSDSECDTKESSTSFRNNVESVSA